MHCPYTEKCALRGSRRRRRKLGPACLNCRRLQTQQREPRRLHRRNPPRDPRWPPQKPNRSPHAMELPESVKSRRIGERESAYHRRSGRQPGARSRPEHLAGCRRSIQTRLARVSGSTEMRCIDTTTCCGHTAHDFRSSTPAAFKESGHHRLNYKPLK